MKEENKKPPEAAPQLPKSGNTEKPGEENGGRKGPEPTRYGDWENKGKCVDF